MESLRQYGFELNAISLGLGAVVAALSYYVIYNYLTSQVKDKDKKDDNYILMYSVTPSVILGILTIFVYTKYSKGGLSLPGSSSFGSNPLLQEDFYG